eukprot:763865-Prorocentrum_minimum.AAC.1
MVSVPRGGRWEEAAHRQGNSVRNSKCPSLSFNFRDSDWTLDWTRSSNISSYAVVKHPPPEMAQGSRGKPSSWDFRTLNSDS